VHHDRGLLDGLHQRGHYGVFHQHRQGPPTAQVVGGDGHAGLGAADHHLAQALTHILKGGGG